MLKCLDVMMIRADEAKAQFTLMQITEGFNAMIQKNKQLNDPDRMGDARDEYHESTINMREITSHLQAMAVDEDEPAEEEDNGDLERQMREIFHSLPAPAASNRTSSGQSSAIAGRGSGSGSRDNAAPSADENLISRAPVPPTDRIVLDMRNIDLSNMLEH